jgi:hypothetical protein
MRTKILRAVTAAALIPGTFTAAGPAPDEWHCAALNGRGDQLCLHLNQFLGWWTGFSAEYRRSSNAGTWANVIIYWAGSRQSGHLPDPSWPYLVRAGEIASGGSWADLPSRSCVSVRALVWESTGQHTVSAPLTVCRDN